MRLPYWVGVLSAIGCGSHTFELLPDAGGGCKQAVALAPAPANLVVLVDRSASMNKRFGAKNSRWDALHQSFVEVASTYQDRVRFGVALFPGLDQSCNFGGSCQQGRVFADLPATITDIDQVFTTARRCGNFGTPTDAALAALADYAPLHDSMRDAYVLLVTDDKSSCKDPSRSATALSVQGLGVRTFVLGIGNEVDGAEAAATAAAGKTAKSTKPYYQVDNDELLLTASLREIASRARSCSYSLASVPVDPNSLVARIDDTITTAWTYDTAANQVTLVGESCQTVRENEQSVVTVSDCSAIE